MKRAVLDASALISFFEDRQGAEVIENWIAESVAGKAEIFISVVNWGEVYYSAWRARGRDSARRIAAEISQFPIQIVNADPELTASAAGLRAEYKLPYADCFAAALAKATNARVLTADRDFESVKSEVSVDFL
jgi:predicted nucleic acid-binding protein